MSKLACGHPVECEEQVDHNLNCCGWCAVINERDSLAQAYRDRSADLARAVEAEREACAKVAETIPPVIEGDAWNHGVTIRDAIRARSIPPADRETR